MKKPAIILVPLAALTLSACSSPAPFSGDPKPRETVNRPTASISTSLEQLCFDDDLAAVRKNAKDELGWTKPESCKGFTQSRFEEIHRLVLLKFEVNG